MTPINLKAKRVLRGVSWNYFSGDCSAGNRCYFAPGIWLNYLGFRLSMRYVKGKKK